MTAKERIGRPVGWATIGLILGVIATLVTLTQLPFAAGATVKTVANLERDLPKYRDEALHAAAMAEARALDAVRNSEERVNKRLDSIDTGVVRMNDKLDSLIWRITTGAAKGAP